MFIMDSIDEECISITASDWAKDIIPSNKAEGITNLLNPLFLIVSAIDRIGIYPNSVTNLFDPPCLLISAKSGIGPCTACS